MNLIHETERLDFVNFEFVIILISFFCLMQRQFKYDVCCEAYIIFSIKNIG